MGIHKRVMTKNTQIKELSLPDGKDPEYTIFLDRGRLRIHYMVIWGRRSTVET